MSDTQVANPWRATARTAFAVLVAVLTAIPVLLLDAGIDHTVIGAQILFVTSAITRVLANPVVDGLIKSYLPFLAASPDRSVGKHAE